MFLRIPDLSICTRYICLGRVIRRSWWSMTLRLLLLHGILWNLEFVLFVVVSSIFCMWHVDERLGLIKARYTGGNEAHGEFLAFIDAHVFVGPNWLTTPHRYLMQNPNTTVNFINFSLEASVYLPKRAWHGIGSSATISADLRQFWGGGSKTDNTSPITMGMFATSKFWWNQGTMDPLLRVWGGENVEISLR